MMNVTYLGHSGFFVEMEDASFLFDYYKGEVPKPDAEKKMFVFVSHVHYDHYNREIFRLGQNLEDVRYILSADIPMENVFFGEDVPEKEKVIFMDPGEEQKILGCSVRTLRSNDEGVAFLIHYAGKTLYHAGDLNWWHWEGEPEVYNTGMRRSYQAEINKLQKEKIDAAFVPVDPRLGEQYCLGIDCFMRRTDTKKVYPMHFWGNYGVFDRLMLEECTREYRNKIVNIEREGQIFAG